MDITLDWIGPESSEALFSGKQCRGVYLWGFSIDQEFVPYYLGIAENIHYRLTEHLNSIIGGRYTIFHKNSLKNFAKHKGSAVIPEKDEGVIFIPDWPSGYHVFLKERQRLQPHIDFMVEKFTFYYATLDTLLISNLDLREIEKICIKHIGKECLINTRGGHSERFHIEHKGSSTLLKLLNLNNIQL